MRATTTVASTTLVRNERDCEGMHADETLDFDFEMRNGGSRTKHNQSNAHIFMTDGECIQTIITKETVHPVISYSSITCHGNGLAS